MLADNGAADSVRARLGLLCSHSRCRCCSVGRFSLYFCDDYGNRLCLWLLPGFVCVYATLVFRLAGICKRKRSESVRLTIIITNGH